MAAALLPPTLSNNYRDRALRPKSHIYLSMAVYFDRDDVSLPGLAKFFLDKCGG